MSGDSYIQCPVKGSMRESFFKSVAYCPVCTVRTCAATCRRLYAFFLNVFCTAEGCILLLLLFIVLNFCSSFIFCVGQRTNNSKMDPAECLLCRQIQDDDDVFCLFCANRLWARVTFPLARVTFLLPCDLLAYFVKVGSGDFSAPLR